MASTALIKEKEKNKKLKASNAKKRREEADRTEALWGTVAGVGGATLASVGSAMVDAKFAKEEDKMATFGDSNVPIVPVMGALSGALGVGLHMAGAPTIGKFFGWGGVQSMGIGIYEGTKDRARKMFEDDDEE